MVPPWLANLRIFKEAPRHNAASFTPRVIAIILIILFIFLGWTFYWLLAAEKRTLIEARRQALQEQVNLALSVCRQLDAEVQDGQLARPAALEQGRELLRSLRTGGMGGGYFIVVDTAGVMQVQPLRPDLEGTNVLDLVDERGVPFIRDIIRRSAHEPRGQLDYYWQWQGEGSSGKSIAAYVTFEPWSWVIVAHMQISDIDSLIADSLTRQVLILCLLSLVLALVLATTLKRLVLSGVDRFVEAAARLEQGELSTRIPFSPTDEMSILAKSFNAMAEGIEQREEQVRLVTRASVFALAKLAEARDRETGGHLLRVREYATILANALRRYPQWRDLIDAVFIGDLYDAVMLHDIGKVAIPDSILLKPSVLDDGERAIMMSHTLVGANTIRLAREQMNVNSSFLKLAEQIARSHHERWDGDGYVECLKGEEIPPAARIFTVADIYDALTTRRTYKQAYSHEEALELMREDRGKRFDPLVFDAFVTVGDEFNRVRQEYADK